MAFNQPRMQDEQGNGKIRRYVHQQLHIDHFDVHCHIQSNGKIKLTKPVGRGSEEYDEIEIPASLVFKLAGLLKATRNVEFVAVAEVKPEDKAEILAAAEAEKQAS